MYFPYISRSHCDIDTVELYIWTTVLPQYCTQHFTYHEISCVHCLSMKHIIYKYGLMSSIGPLGPLIQQSLNIINS